MHLLFPKRLAAGVHCILSAWGKTTLRTSGLLVILKGTRGIDLNTVTQRWKEDSI